MEGVEHHDTGEAPTSSGDGGDERRGSDGRREDDRRSVAQLNMLHSLAANLGRMNDVEQIGGAITTELSTIIDYHNCRIYLLQDDGDTLWPIVFRGQIGEYIDETFEELVSKVGEGITGRVAETGESMLIENALWLDWAVTIEGTDDIDESMLAVPLKIGDRVTGVIVLSSLGIGKFDDVDRRLLEVLSSHAAVAIENAKLLQSEREAAEISAALLRAVAGPHPRPRPRRPSCRRRPIGLRNCFPDRGSSPTCGNQPPGSSACVPCTGSTSRRRAPPAKAPTSTRRMPTGCSASVREPFVIPRQVLAELPDRYRLGGGEPLDALIAPVRFEPDGFAAFGIVARDEAAVFSDRDKRLARGLADLTSLALGNARRFSELERFYELVEGIDAVFWEADPRSLHLTFVSGRATELLREPESLNHLGRPHARAGSWECDRRASRRDPRSRRRQHRVPDPERRRRGSVAARSGQRRARPDGRSGAPTRDDGRHHGAQARRTGPPGERAEVLRGVRAGAGGCERLRALDEMKNTFLEAVSHDLRTPLTSILGSAITLERTGMELPDEDALDWSHRIAANARKLERLLGDLLDLDRLQRGIIAPQRRPTDVGALVRLACGQTELLGRRVEVEVDAAQVIASVDAAKVERIVENLLVNAVRHTPAGREAVDPRAAVRDRGGDRRRGRRSRRSRGRPRGDLRAVPPAPGRGRALAGGRDRARRSSPGSPSCTAAAPGSMSGPAAAPSFHVLLPGA